MCTCISKYTDMCYECTLGEIHIYIHMGMPASNVNKVYMRQALTSTCMHVCMYVLMNDNLAMYIVHLSASTEYV